MRIGYAQFDCQFGDKAANLNTIARLTARSRADILVFPELCLTGYGYSGFGEAVQYSERIPEGVSIQRLRDIASQNSCMLIVGLVESMEEGGGFSNAYYDSVVVISPYGYHEKYQKTHLFLREKGIFSPGYTGPCIVEWRGVRIGIGICYDYMFPEYWRTLALRGVDVFCNAANFVYDYGFKMMQARAIENGVYSICTNRVGTERGTTFRGGSEIVDCRGNILAKGGETEEVITVEVDLKKSRDKKWNPTNDLFKDRRPEMYGV